MPHAHSRQQNAAKVYTRDTCSLVVIAHINRTPSDTNLQLVIIKPFVFNQSRTEITRIIHKVALNEATYTQVLPLLPQVLKGFLLFWAWATYQRLLCMCDDFVQALPLAKGPPVKVVLTTNLLQGCNAQAKL